MKMCAALAHTGCEVELIVPQYRDGVAPSLQETFDYYDCPATFKIHRTNLSIPGGLPFAIAALKRVIGQRSDLVYARCVRSCALAAIARFPVVHEVHGPLESYSRSGRVAFRWLAGTSRLRRIVAINAALADYYSARFPRLSRHPHIAPSGTDPVQAIPIFRSLVPGDRLRVGYVGSLYPGKGMELISELANRTDHEFIVAGGHDASIAHWKAQVGGRVKFLGHVPNRDVSALIDTFDVALAPYLENVGGLSVTFNLARWMSPLKLFEYMAHARAILVSDLPAIREVVQDGEEVLLCSPRDVEEWIMALDRLAQDPALREKLGRNALATFLKRFTWDQRAAGILKAIAA